MLGEILLYDVQFGETHKVFLSERNCEAYVFEVNGKQVFKIVLDNELTKELRPRELEKQMKILHNLMKQFNDLIAFTKTLNFAQDEQEQELPLNDNNPAKNLPDK